MALEVQIKLLADRARKHPERFKTPEATFRGLVEPLLQELGYDVFDPVVLERVEWLQGLDLNDHFVWSGLEGSGRFTKTSYIHKRWKELPGRERAHSHGRARRDLDDAGKRRAEDLKSLHRALDLLKGEASWPPAAIFWIRDADNAEAERTAGAEVFRQGLQRTDPTFVIGLACPKREAWVLHGFDADDADEAERLGGLRSALGHDPCHRSHELTASGAQDLRSAKRVCGVLLGADVCSSDRLCCRPPTRLLQHASTDAMCRERRCWMLTPLSTLRARGEHTGLRAYLNEVEHRIVPLLAS